MVGGKENWRFRKEAKDESREITGWIKKEK